MAGPASRTMNHHFMFFSKIIAVHCENFTIQIHTARANGEIIHVEACVGYTREPRSFKRLIVLNFHL